MALLGIEMDALVTRSLVALHGEDELYLILRFKPKPSIYLLLWSRFISFECW